MKNILKLLLVLGLLLRAGHASAAPEDDRDLAASRSSSFLTSSTPTLPNGKSLEEWKTAIEKIEEIVADRMGYNGTLLAFMKRKDLSVEARLEVYRGVVGGLPKGNNPLDSAVSSIEADLKIYDVTHDQFMRQIKVYTSLVESGRSITSFKIVEVLDELYMGLYGKYLTEENAQKKFIDFHKKSKKVSIHTKLECISNQKIAGELLYLEGILHALASFVDKVTIDVHAKYYREVATADGTIIGAYKIEREILEKIFARRDELQGKRIVVHALSNNPVDVEAANRSLKEHINSINENLNNAQLAYDNLILIDKELRTTKEKVTQESMGDKRQQLIKNLKEFEKCLTTAENLIGMLEKRTLKISKKKKDSNTVSGSAAAAPATRANHAGFSDHSLTQTDMQSSFPVNSSSSSSSSSTPSSSASSFGREMIDKEKRRYDQATEQHIYGKKREPKSGADLEKLTKEVNLFKAVAEDNHTKQNIRYEEMLTLVRRMGGDVFPFGKKGGSHRRIEIPHVNNGKIITCGTYEPHGGEGYPLWLDFSMNAITRAMA
ncbi:hypothetical protein [Candidatus Finniella inopinata]|uniref:Uncharacterized protein n=1 Tax=Candidatus Finniella inopinata TaxID=1696036 RepID=A0A4Q7DIJ4_9PROT|nr:hypothetical protein [Candidatus Finniella inopinata]RZI45794.1 hypothetical protein EQU50_04990 [Candidatus Finniella inopinata]